MSERTDAELLLIASGSVAGTLFASWHLRIEDRDQLPSVFTPLMFADLPEGVGHVFEWMDKAAPRTINGLPSFFSMQTLTVAECDRLAPMLGALSSPTDAGEGGGT